MDAPAIAGIIIGFCTYVSVAGLLVFAAAPAFLALTAALLPAAIAGLVAFLIVRSSTLHGALIRAATTATLVIILAVVGFNTRATIDLGPAIDKLTDAQGTKFAIGGESAQIDALQLLIMAGLVAAMIGAAIYFVHAARK